MSDVLSAIYNKLTEKTKKEIESVLESTFVIEYRKITSYVSGSYGLIHELPQEQAKTVEKRIIKLYKGYVPPENQDLLKALYEAELRIIELEKLESSINNIKQFLNKGEK